jgi:hypothetical protein
MAKRCQSRRVAESTSSGEVVLAPYGDGEQAYLVMAISVPGYPSETFRTGLVA